MRPRNPQGSYKIQHPEPRDPASVAMGVAAMGLVLLAAAVLFCSLALQAMEQQVLFEANLEENKDATTD